MLITIKEPQRHWKLIDPIHLSISFSQANTRLQIEGKFFSLPNSIIRWSLAKVFIDKLFRHSFLNLVNSLERVIIWTLDSKEEGIGDLVPRY